MSDQITKFEDLNVWKEAMQLAVDIYRALNNCKDFGIRDQMQRCSVSIPSNIAEGYERQSNKEFIQYLYISKGSCVELRTQLYLSIDLKIIETAEANRLLESTRKISAMLYNLIKSRKERFK